MMLSSKDGCAPTHCASQPACPPGTCRRATLEQRQDSLNDQLADVAREAERMGCYDAADWIRRQVKQRAAITPAMRATALELMKEYRNG